MAQIGSVELASAAYGTPSRLDRRQLFRADDIFARESVETGSGGSLHILFLDATNFRLGASSSMVLDRYIYDPDEGNQALVVRLSAGVFRIISGKLRKTAFRIDTPVATIGIRGTDFEVTVADDGSTTVSVNQGTVEVSVNEGVGDFAQLSEAVRAGLSIAVSASTGQTTLGRASPSRDPGLRGPPGERSRERADEAVEKQRGRAATRTRGGAWSHRGTCRR